MFRKVLLSALFVAPLLIISSPAVNATPTHHEQSDGCDHGNAGKPCKPDPQPDHGKDCEEHGNHGGVNEDHCADEEVPTSTTTTTTPATTSTTGPASTTTTTAGVVSSTTSPAPTAEPAPTPAPHAAPALLVEPATQTNPAELPRTGGDAGLLFVIGVAVLVAGLTTWFAGKAID